MKRALAILLTLCLIVSLAGCVSQSDLDAVIAEKDALQANYDALQADYAAMQATLDQHADLISAVDREEYEQAMLIIEEKQLDKLLAEKGDIEEFLITVELTPENFDEYFEWKTFYNLNSFGESMENEISFVLSSKAYDQDLILYDTDAKLGFTATAKMTGSYGSTTDSFNSTGDLTPGYLCGTGWSASEEVSFDLENCFVETTRVEGTVTFVKEEYVADYKLSEMDTNSYQNADITLVNGEHISRSIRFGCKF